MADFFTFPLFLIFRDRQCLKHVVNHLEWNVARIVCSEIAYQGVQTAVVACGFVAAGPLDPHGQAWLVQRRHPFASVPGRDTEPDSGRKDLNLSFPLSHWVREGRVSPVKGNRVSAPAPQPGPIKIDDDHLVYPLNTEYELGGIGGRRHALGAVLIIGHKTLFHQGAPPVAPVAEQAHREGALLDFEKHSWSWSLMLAPVMKVDLFELSNNHVWPGPFQLGKWTFEMNPAYMRVAIDQNGYTEWGWIDYGFQTYYALLNCGFRIQPTAGTGSGAHPVPLGFGRVYVQQPDGFSYENWIEGLKAGRSFVTTGPMLLATVNGKPAGHIFVSASTGGVYRVAGRVESRYSVDRVEIVVDGLVVRTLKPFGERTPDEGLRTLFSADV